MRSPTATLLDLVNRFGIFSGSGKQIDLPHVFDVAEVPAGIPVSVDIHRFAFDHAGKPFGDDRSVSAVRDLPLAEQQRHSLVPGNNSEPLPLQNHADPPANDFQI